MSNLLSSLLLFTQRENKADKEFDEFIEECKHISYLMTLDDWTGHEEEYENEIIEHFNCINTDKREIRKTLDDIREKHDIDFTPEICERCSTIISEGWICNNKPYCSEDCIKRTISEDKWISMQEYEPDENKRKIFWG